MSKCLTRSVITQQEFMMAPRIEITRAFVHLLAKCNSQRRQVLLENATNEQLKGLFELCMNMKRGNLPINSVQLQRFRRHKKTFDTLANKRISIRKKRAVINQQGGFVAAVAKFALPLLTHIIASQISKRVKHRR